MVKQAGTLVQTFIDQRHTPARANTASQQLMTVGVTKSHYSYGQLLPHNSHPLAQIYTKRDIFDAQSNAQLQTAKAVASAKRHLKEIQDKRQLS